MIVTVPYAVRNELGQFMKLRHSLFWATYRAAKSHALGVRLTHLRSISRSHANIWISHAKPRMQGLKNFFK